MAWPRFDEWRWRWNGLCGLVGLGFDSNGQGKKRAPQNGWVRAMPLKMGIHFIFGCALFVYSRMA